MLSCRIHQEFYGCDQDLKNTVLSYIPNTAEVAFYGMISGMEAYLKDVKKRKILALGPNPDEEKLEEILSIRPTQVLTLGFRTL